MWVYKLKCKDCGDEFWTGLSPTEAKCYQCDSPHLIVVGRTWREEVGEMKISYLSPFLSGGDDVRELSIAIDEIIDKVNKIIDVINNKVLVGEKK